MKSLDKAVNVLQLFTVTPSLWSLTELSHEANIPLSTLHRIVTVLNRHGLLARDPQSRKYRLGFGAMNLGYHASFSWDIARFAQPAMVWLAQETGETVHLTVVNETRDCSVCVARVDSQFHALRIHLEVGRQIPLHAGASAKVLLAYFPPAEVDEVIRRTGLPKLASNTITDAELVKRELTAIRRQGYAFSQEETHDGAWGYAVPILDIQQRAVAGLGLSGPTARYSADVEERCVRLVKDAAKQIAATLGLGARQPGTDSCMPVVL